MNRTFLKSALAVTCGCALLMLARSEGISRAWGQEAAGGGASLAFPTGDRATSNLLVEVTPPAQAAVGRPYEYQIRVTNLTKTLSLDDVTVSQTLAEGFAVEKSTPEPMRSQGSDEVRWHFAKLGPGETQTIKVTGLGEKEGKVQSCFRASYQPALCVATEFTKPEIQVTKQAPENADLCDTITLRYMVKNTGSGVAKGVTLRDELPEGFAMEKGTRVISSDMGDLKQGESKEFTAKVVPNGPGEFSSRAMVKGANDLHARSNETKTAVRQAKLNVAIEGPDAEYANQSATYRVTVKNEGKAAARAAKLVVQADPNFRTDRMSKSDPKGVTPQAQGNTLTWDLGDLAPGAQAVVSLTGTPKGQKAIHHVATVASECARDSDLARAETDIRTEILTLPALLLELVDRTDPVRQGDNEVYTILVLNQGDGADQNVKITCTLPDGMSYVSSDGPTKGTADGQKVTFEAIPNLEAKEKATWTVTAKADKPGDVRTRVELTSEYLHNPVPETEPTRMID